MISATAARRPKITPQITFPQISGVDYRQSAKDNRYSLSQNIQNNFLFAAFKTQIVVPVFNAAVAHIKPLMDKMSTIGKGGMLPWAKPQMGNGGENSIIGMMRARARAFRDKQSRSHRLAVS